MLPSIFLSGYIFPLDNMPWIFHLISFFVPATYMMQIWRGIILRSAGFSDLWVNAGTPSPNDRSAKFQEDDCLAFARL